MYLKEFKQNINVNELALASAKRPVQPSGTVWTDHRFMATIDPNVAMPVGLGLVGGDASLDSDFIVEPHRG